MIKFFIFLLFFLLYQSVSISKINEIENFNQKYLSNYFSGIVSLKNEETEASFKFLENSYPISETHKNYLKNYLVSLVMNRQVDKAIKKIKDRKKRPKEIYFTNHFFYSENQKIDRIKTKKNALSNNIVHKLT